LNLRSFLAVPANVRDRSARPVLVAGALLSAAIHCARQPPIRDLASSATVLCPLDGTSPLPSTFRVGAFLGDTIRDARRMDRAVDEFGRRVGRPPQIVKTFHSLGSNLGIAGEGAAIQSLLRAGIRPMLSIEPTWRGSPANGLLSWIASGQADSLVRRRARELNTVIGSTSGGDTILVELASEMNARFGAPWQAEANGSAQAAAVFVRMWRRVVEVFREEGVERIAWVWAPSAGNPYTHHPTGASHWNWQGHYFPGEGWVTYMGLHAFNDPLSQRAWIPVRELVTGDAADHALSILLNVHPRMPVILSEIASDEHPRDQSAKGRWMLDLFAVTAACPRIAGIVWFDASKERDWRIGSSTASLLAFKEGLARR
jgi:hypothetical protein